MFYCEGAGGFNRERDRLSPLQCPSIETLVTLGWKGTEVVTAVFPSLNGWGRRRGLERFGVCIVRAHVVNLRRVRARGGWEWTQWINYYNSSPGPHVYGSTQIIVCLSDFHFVHCSVCTLCVFVTGEVRG